MLRPGHGVTYITDFATTEDVVDVRALGLVGIGQFKAQFDFTDTALGLRIELGEGELVFIDGLTAAGARNLDFLF